MTARSTLFTEGAHCATITDKTCNARSTDGAVVGTGGAVIGSDEGGRRPRTGSQIALGGSSALCGAIEADSFNAVGQSQHAENGRRIDPREVQTQAYGANPMRTNGRRLARLMTSIGCGGRDRELPGLTDSAGYTAETVPIRPCRRDVEERYQDL